MLIALCHCLCAQTPHIEISGADTMAVVPLQQVRIANSTTIDLKECQEENDSLYSQIRTYTGMVNNLRSSIKELKTTNDLNTSLMNGQEQIIDICGKQLKKASRSNKLLKWERNGAVIGCLLLIGKLALFH